MVRRLNVVHASQSPGLYVLEVCFESETTNFCNNYRIVVKRVNVVHDSQSLGQSGVIFIGLPRIRNQRFLQQPFPHGETSQCCQ